MSKWIVTVIILLLPLTVCAEPWDNTDKALFAVWMGAKIIDAGQTHNICKDGNLSEHNKAIEHITDKAGDNAVYPYFALTTVLGYLIADNLPPGWRKGFLAGCTVLETYLAIDNDRAGIGVRF